MLGVERRRPRQHARRIDVQEGAEPAAGRVAAIEPGDARQERLGDLRRRCLPAANRLARLARGPLVDRAAHPITFGTRNRPELAGGVGGVAQRRLAAERRLRLVGAQRRPIELDVRGRLDARGVDGADLLDVGEDGGQLAAKPGPLVGGQGQPGELGDAQDVTV